MATVATHEHEFPELRKENGEVVEATIHLLDEEMEIAERLERKGREQWQLVTFLAPLAIAGSLTAAGTQGVGPVWIGFIGVTSLVTLGLLLWTMFLSSEMANVQEAEAVNPDRLDGYLEQLHRDQGEQSEAQVRAALARTLVNVARSRSETNDTRRTQLRSVINASRATCIGSVLVLVLAAIAVMVNA